MRKYHNHKVIDDEITFDSLMEHRRYVQLKMMQKAGAILDLHVHPTFKLQPAYYSNSQRKKIQAITYTADYSYLEDGKVVVEDVKGFKTAVFNLKRRMLEYLYPNILFKVVEDV
jgi:hypothetical protein